jgi:hypothetical protein
LLKKIRAPLDGDLENVEASGGKEGELQSLLQRVETAIRACTGDRAVLKEEEVHRIQAAVKRLEEMVRERIDILNKG